MINVDVFTVIIGLVVGHGVSIPLLILDIFRYERTKYDYLFLLGRVLQLAGWLLLISVKWFSGWAYLPAGRSLLVLGWILEALAIIALKFIVSDRCRNLYSTVFGLSLLLIWPVFSLPTTLTSTLASLLPIFIFAIPGAALLFSHRRSSSLQKLIGAMYGLCCTALLWRGTDMLLSGSVDLSTGRTTHVAGLLVFHGLLTFGALGYVLINKEKLNREMQTIADTDPLTGLLNRRAFVLMAEGVRQLAVRRNSDFALLMLDIDHFKRINDRYGHVTGDGILINLAEALRRNMRASDLACRYGGEEFVLLLPDCDKTGAVQIAERIRLTIEKSCPGSICYTASIGVSAASGQEIVLEKLINQADTAMYKAKELGRNRVQSYP